MKKLFTGIALFLSATGFAQNVGIGETAPTDMKLQVKRADSAILLLQNSTPTGINKTGMFFKTGSNYSGSIATIGSGATFRMGLFTFGGSSPSDLIERISILDGGNVGIGTTSPSAKLDVNGSFRLSGGSPGAGKFLISDPTGFASWYDLTPSLLPGGATGNTLRHNGTGWVANNVLYNNGTSIGIGTVSPTARLEVSASGYGILQNDGTVSVGTYTSALGGWLGTRTAHALHFFTNNSNPLATLNTAGNFGIGTQAPTAPLSFANITGNKITLWGDASGGHYGLGIQGSLLQLYGSANNADIAFGYGSSTSFTENMRVKGNGVVGIGTNNPLIGGLVVNKIVGNTNAVFGANTTGVSIQSSYPGIGFNTYYNGGSFMISNGGAGYIGVDPTNSKIILSNTGGNAAAGTPTFLQDKMWIEYDGTVSLGSGNLNAENASLGSGYKLKVFGKIISEEVRVQLKAAWPDYVFEKDYKKLSLNELEQFVNEHKHLPNIPSAKEITKDGQHLGEIQMKMLEKIEELSLYVIELNKKIKMLEEKNSSSAIKN